MYKPMYQWVQENPWVWNVSQLLLSHCKGGHSTCSVVYTQEESLLFHNSQCVQESVCAHWSCTIFPSSPFLCLMGRSLIQFWENQDIKSYMRRLGLPLMHKPGNIINIQWEPSEPSSGHPLGVRIALPFPRYYAEINFYSLPRYPD